MNVKGKQKLGSGNVGLGRGRFEQIQKSGKCWNANIAKQYLYRRNSFTSEHILYTVVGGGGERHLQNPVFLEHHHFVYRPVQVVITPTSPFLGGLNLLCRRGAFKFLVEIESSLVFPSLGEHISEEETNLLTSFFFYQELVLAWSLFTDAGRFFNLHARAHHSYHWSFMKFNYFP